jgi:hypothetical protein
VTIAGVVPRAAGDGYDSRPMSTESARFEIRPRRRAGVAAALLLAAACQPTRGGPVPGGTGAGGHAPPAGPGCGDVITAAGARQIFERVTALRASDGCVVDGVSTQLSVMRITWSRNGAVLPAAVLVTPSACASGGSATAGQYTFQQSEAFAAQCPATFAALTRTFSHDAPPPTHAAQLARRSRGRLWVLAALGALALGALAGLRWRRRRAPDVALTPAPVEPAPTPPDAA